LLIVDAANVMGSVPDGWWRDRAGAARRLREALNTVAKDGLPGARIEAPEVVLVVEGAARPIAADPGADDLVRVVAAPRTGDEAIIELVREAVPRRTVAVVTADRALRTTVTRLGASVLGPRSLPHLHR
jgi:hypothetical protein